MAIWPPVRKDITGLLSNALLSWSMIVLVYSKGPFAVASYVELLLTIMKNLKLTSDSAAQTETIAHKIGRRLKGGEVIELASDLGGGKTTFVRGLAAGAGSSDNVASPTFTISRVYKAKDLHIYHYDFYRLPEAGLMKYELEDHLARPADVVIVEWANVVEEVLPAKRLRIQFNYGANDERQLEVTYPLELAYLVEDICWY